MQSGRPLSSGLVYALVLSFLFACAKKNVGQSPQASTPTAKRFLAVGSTIIGDEGGSVADSSVQITFPPGSVNTRLEVSVSKSEDVPEGYLGRSSLFRFEPSGSSFNFPVKVSIQLASDAVNPQLYWSNHSGGYDVIPSTVSEGVITGYVSHFSEGFAAEFAEAEEGMIGDLIDSPKAIPDLEVEEISEVTFRSESCAPVSTPTTEPEPTSTPNTESEPTLTSSPEPTPTQESSPPESSLGRCGDWNIDYTMSEECDDGNTQSGDGCSSECRREYCGDGLFNGEFFEECDDGNAASNDGCSSGCYIERCGDFHIQVYAGENCDDGNSYDGDGCSSSCQIEYEAGSESFPTSLPVADPSAFFPSISEIIARFVWELPRLFTVPEACAAQECGSELPPKAPAKLVGRETAYERNAVPLEGETGEAIYKQYCGPDGKGVTGTDTFSMRGDTAMVTFQQTALNMHYEISEGSEGGLWNATQVFLYGPPEDRHHHEVLTPGKISYWKIDAENRNKLWDYLKETSATRSGAEKRLRAFDLLLQYALDHELIHEAHHHEYYERYEKLLNTPLLPTSVEGSSKDVAQIKILLRVGDDRRARVKVLAAALRECSNYQFHDREYKRGQIASVMLGCLCNKSATDCALVNAVNEPKFKGAFPCKWPE